MHGGQRKLGQLMSWLALGAVWGGPPTKGTQAGPMPVLPASAAVRRGVDTGQQCGPFPTSPLHRHSGLSPLGLV